MKRLYCMAAAFLAVALNAFAQGGNTGDGGPDGDYASLAGRVLNLEKKTEAFNFYFNYAGSYQLTERSGALSSAFRAKQLRLEVKGNFGEHLSYRLRHRMNKGQGAMSEENFGKATDIMYLGWKFSDKFTLIAGKMCQWWGGFEFDENPMFIYQYSDMVDCMDNFLVGTALVLQPLPGQEFVLNITNSYSGVLSDEYGPSAMTVSGGTLTAASHPLAYIFNWNGSFLGDMLQTRWSIGSYTQAVGYHDRMLFLGEKLNLPRFQVYFDFIGSWEGLDRLRIASSEIGAGKIVTDVRYLTYLTKMNWQFAPKWNLMGKGMYETATVPSLGKYRTSLGYIASLEYYPMKDQDLRFFVAYLGRAFLYSERSGIPSYFTNRLEVGFMYRIKCY